MIIATGIILMAIGVFCACLYPLVRLAARYTPELHAMMPDWEAEAIENGFYDRSAKAAGCIWKCLCCLLLVGGLAVLFIGVCK